MNCYRINTDSLRSMSVEPEEVCAISVLPGEVLRCKQERLSWDKPVVCIVDRFNWARRSCTMVRQVLEAPYEDWGQDYIEPNRKARDLARRAGCERVTVPGGIPPLTLEGTVAVPDFNMSGTSWFVANESILAAVPEAVVHFLGADDNCAACN